MFFVIDKKSTTSTSQELGEYLRGFGSNSVAGVTVSPKTALAYAPVFSCIRVLAESIGQLPMHLFKSVSGVTEKAVDHRLYEIVNLSPNFYQSSIEFREMMVAHLCLRGNFYAHINRVNGQVRELLPLQPDAVEPRFNNQQNVVYVVNFSDGTSDVLPAKDIFHVRLMSQDGLKGLSIIQQAKNSIGLGVAVESYGSHLFKNGARPGGILSTEASLNSDQIDLMRSQFEQLHGGSENAHKVAVLQGGLKWAAVGMTPEDSQFLDTQKYKRSEIAGMFRLPPHLIGDLERSTFSNIEQQSLDFVMHTILPWATKIEQRCLISLLTASERKKYFVKLNVEGLLRGDSKARAEYFTKLYNIGVLNPNEIRAIENMNPRTDEGGDTYVHPGNMVPDSGSKPDDDKK